MHKRLLLFAFILTVISCSMPDFNKLGMPTWDTTLNLYILNDTYDAIQLAEEDSSLVAFGDTLGLYETASDEGDIEFSTDPSGNNEFMEIGDIFIDNPDPTETEIPLADVDPSLTNGFLPAPGVLPFIMPEIVKDDVEPFGEFEEISFISGEVVISLINHTAIWFGNVNAGHPLVIHILDMDDNEILAQPFSEDVPPDSTITITEIVDMAGETMVNDIKIKLSGGSRGTDGDAATIDIDATLDIQVEVIDLVADHAIAQLPEQEIIDSVIVELDEDITIYKGDIAQGNYTLTLEIENAIDMDIAADLHIGKLTLPGETEYFSQVVNVPRSGGVGSVAFHTEVIDISQSTLGRAPDYDEPLEKITLSVVALMLDSGDEYREIDYNDAFNVDITVNELEFDYVNGVLDPKEQDEISGHTLLGMEYPYIDGSLEVVSFSTITFDFFTPIPSTMEVEIFSFNADNDSVRMKEFSTGNNPVFELPTGQSEVIFTSDEYNINEMISILPDSVYYVIYPVVGDSTELFDYYDGDKITADIVIQSQLDFAADCWIIPKNEDGEPDVQTVDTKDFDQEVIDAFLDGKLILHYNNGLGIDTGADILISDLSPNGFNELINPDTTKFTIIDVPPILYSNGTAMDSIEVAVSPLDLQLFVADSVFIIPKLRLQSSQGSPVAGSMTMQGELQLKIEVSSELVE